MKAPINKSIVALALAGALSFSSRAATQPADPNNTPPAQPENTDTNTEPGVADLIQAVVAAQQQVGDDQSTNAPDGNAGPGGLRAIRGQGMRGTRGTNGVSLADLLSQPSTNRPAGVPANLLRLNFRKAPLGMVLDYLSEAAGFTISPESKVDLKGEVTVWSNRPVTQDEAIQILNKSLTEHHYGATVDGSVLNIFVLDAGNAPIASGIPGNEYTNIPPTQEMVTQIVYVHNVEVGQLITSLQPLMPPGTSMNQNQGANAIIISDTKANIRRMVQLVKSLDTTSVSASTVQVFPLTYADATTLAQVITQLFQSNETGNNNNNGRGGFGRFFGGGGFPGGPFGGGNNNGGNNAAQSGRVAAAKVTAVADDRSNSLVVSAAEDQMKYIADLVNQMDVNVDDVVDVHVFRLRYADPQDTADQISQVYPDPTTQQNSNNRGGGRFGFFGGFGGGNQNNSSASSNSRKVRLARVSAVAEPRTGSVIVSASKDIMAQIKDLIEQLDSDPAKKKRVFTIAVENRDPSDLVEELQSVISQDTSGGNNANTRNNTQTSGSQLNTRQRNNLQNQGSSTTSSSRNSTLGR